MSSDNNFNSLENKVGGGVLGGNSTDAGYNTESTESNIQTTNFSTNLPNNYSKSSFADNSEQNNQSHSNEDGNNSFFSKLIKDVLAGITVSFAALALGAGFGLASGRGVLAGVLSAAIIPIITSLFGGTRIQASGPTGPMTTVMSAIIVAIAADNSGIPQNLAGQFITLVLALNAIILILAGLLNLGKYISLVPQLVIVGFMNGIALIIWKDQLGAIFGLFGKKMLEGNMIANALLAILTFALILLLPKILDALKAPAFVKLFTPGILVSLVLFTLVYQYLLKPGGLALETVKIEAELNSFNDFLKIVRSAWPKDVITLDYIMKALPFAANLTLLAYLDSLLTSLVIDKMTGETTKKNKELIAQGASIMAAGLIGGIPGAQATIRSVLLVKEQAQTRLAGVLIGIFVIIELLVFKNYISMVAMAVFIGVLIKAGWDVFDFGFFKNVVRQKDKLFYWQLGIVVLTSVVTLFDLNLAVFLGTVVYYIAQKYANIQDYSEDGEAIARED